MVATGLVFRSGLPVWGRKLGDSRVLSSLPFNPNNYLNSQKKFQSLPKTVILSPCDQQEMKLSVPEHTSRIGIKTEEA